MALAATDRRNPVAARERARIGSGGQLPALGRVYWWHRKPPRDLCWQTIEIDPIPSSPRFMHRCMRTRKKFVGKFGLSKLNSNA